MSFYQEAIIQQISEIERMYQIMNSQMEEIEQIKATMTQKKKVKKYLEMLHHQYKTIQPGTFSDDMTADAILYYYGNDFRKKGIKMEASFTGYQSGSLDEVYIGKILMCLMETALAVNVEKIYSADRTVKIRGGKTIRHQNVFWMECDWQAEDDREHMQKEIKPCEKQYRENAHFRKQGNKLQAEIVVMKTK